jgi:hypothetical protein
MPGLRRRTFGHWKSRGKFFSPQRRKERKGAQGISTEELSAFSNQHTALKAESLKGIRLNA